jgi:hypothetical protein
MNKMNSSGRHAGAISALCIFVLVCIFVAGLWPFHVPANAVSWLKGENGLRFSRHGAAVSVGAFHTAHAINDTGFSLEMWLTPENTRNGGSVLAFDSSPDPRTPFLVRQYGSSIVIQRSLVDEQRKVSQLWFKVEDVFQSGMPAFVTITSNQDHTDLYVNGVWARRSSEPGIISQELTGRLVLANSTVDDGWAGEFRGLAIYDRELTPAQVSSHFQNWTGDQSPLLTGDRPAIALYFFDERSGSTVHNLADSATNLTIPARYFVLHPGFLRPSWDGRSDIRQALHRWSVWQDLGVNIGGFMPVGFVFSAYFAGVKREGRAALRVVLLGFALSLTIESLQRLLPNRDSGMDDLFTNTTGTVLGVLLYRSSTVRMFWSRSLDFCLSYQKPIATQSLDSPPPAQQEKLTLSA